AAAQRDAAPEPQKVRQSRGVNTRLALPVSLPGLTGQSSTSGRWLLDRPVNPPIKSGEGDDSTEVGESNRKMLWCDRKKPAQRDGGWAFMSMNRCRATISFTMAAMLAAASALSVQAQDAVEAFYQGRQINLIVGYGPGGGYDLTARLLARHIGR